MPATGELPVLANEWMPVPGTNLWKCRLCERAVEGRRRKRHTNSVHHLSLRDNENRQRIPGSVPQQSIRSAIDALALSFGFGPEHPIGIRPTAATNHTATPNIHVPPDSQGSSLQPDLSEEMEYIEDPESLRLGQSAVEEAARDVRASLERLLAGDIALEDSDDEVVERSDDEANLPCADAHGENLDPYGSRRPRNYSADESERRGWFPWAEKLSASLDILAHLPQSVFSETQLELLLWLLEINGVDNVPSVCVMKEEQKALQNLAGIDTRKYKGAFGHTYYVNDIGQIIAQEMANPRVRPHMRFYPEDAGKGLNEAWHGARWRHKIDPALLTPMIRIKNPSSHQDFYVFEPTFLDDESACMPVRWPKRGAAFVALAWRLELSEQRDAWVLREDHQLMVHESSLRWSLPHFERLARTRGLPSPHAISARIKPTGERTVLERRDFTNEWRKKAKGRQVLSFLLWLYCDDTSGNVSKRWNKHNSYLFTPAGLPRAHAQREYNVHFLCTSNLAPPLEMMEGITNQLDDCQREGITAWDCVDREEVLVIPAVLALLGDNPMQSELASHIGLTARMFCRICWVSGGRTDENDESDNDDDERPEAEPPDSMDVEEEDLDRQSVRPPSSAGRSATSGAGGKGPRGKVLETVEEMIDRAKRFLKKGKPRNRDESIHKLREIFRVAISSGGATKAKTMKTETGLKDRFADGVAEHILKLIKKLPDNEATHIIAEELRKYREHIGFLSPVWRIRGLDPHSDTPVEILHVVLLGFLKYFWRDAISRLSDRDKAILTARPSSVEVRGLGIPPLAGKTLVQYCRSLTGGDFRAIAQVAPFVLHNLGLPEECLDAWMALSALVPLLWQPEIEDSELHLAEVEKAIDRFLLCTARWTPRWFNKPKFHLLLHLVDHIRDFGPATLFATEGFESFNAIIRLKSVHSNRLAPSRDIALAFAQMSRLRHLVSGAWFPVREDIAYDRSITEFVGERVIQPQATPGPSQEPPRSERYVYRQLGPLAKELASMDVVSRHVGFYSVGLPSMPGTCTLKAGSALPWSRTSTGRLQGTPVELALQSKLFRKAKDVVIANGDKCEVGDWVLICNDQYPITNQQVAIVIEILQVEGSHEAQTGRASFLSVKLAQISGVSAFHCMPTLRVTDQVMSVKAEHVSCSANVQHNCVACKCRVKGGALFKEEREWSGRTRPEVVHKEPSDVSISPWIMNLAKMRDAKHIQQFRRVVSPPTFDVDPAVRYGVEKEMVNRQAQTAPSAKGKAAGDAEGTPTDGTRPQARRIQQIIGNR